MVAGFDVEKSNCWFIARDIVGTVTRYSKCLECLSLMQI